MVRETYNLELLRVQDLWQGEPAKVLVALDDERRCPPSLRDFAWGYYHRLSEQMRWSRTISKSFLSAAALSPDGQFVACGGEAGVVQLIETASGTVHRELSGHAGWVTDLAWSPAGDRVVSASTDGAIRTWTWPDGKLIQTIAAHESHVNAIAVSPDGIFLVSGGSDGKVKTWQSADGQLLKEASSHDGGVTDLAVTGDAIASAGEDGQVLVWDNHLKPIRSQIGHEAARPGPRCLGRRPTGVR